jgi:hypothetical protein
MYLTQAVIHHHKLCRGRESIGLRSDNKCRGSSDEISNKRLNYMLYKTSIGASVGWCRTQSLAIGQKLEWVHPTEVGREIASNLGKGKNAVIWQKRPSRHAIGKSNMSSNSDVLHHGIHFWFAELNYPVTLDSELIVQYLDSSILHHNIM